MADLGVSPPQTDFESAANRACDNQHNSCADLANSKQGNFAVSDCDKQDSESFPDLPEIPSCPSPLRYSILANSGTAAACKSAATAATQTSFTNTGTGTSSGQPVLVSSNAQFDFFCDP